MEKQLVIEKASTSVPVPVIKLQLCISLWSCPGDRPNSVRQKIKIC